MSLIPFADKLPKKVHEWVTTLTEEDLISILSAVYKLPDLCKKTAASASIGRDAEAAFASLCSQLPLNYKLINTAKQGKKGDFILIFNHDHVEKRALIDIKKYSCTVPKKEIDKFIEDLSYGHYDAGILLSYDSKFVGIPENISMDNLSLPSGKVPVLYLACVSDELILQAIQLIMLKTIVQQSYDLSKIESQISYINDALVHTADTKRMLSELSNTVTNSILKCRENLTDLEQKIKRAIKEMQKDIGKLTETETKSTEIKPRPDNVTTTETKSTVPPGLPTETKSTANTSNPLSDEFDECPFHVRKSDDYAFYSIFRCKWDQRLYGEDIPTCVLVSKFFDIMFTALKTKTKVSMTIKQKCIEPFPPHITYRFETTLTRDFAKYIVDAFETLSS